MIDPESETIITFSQAARRVPGGGVHRASIGRWARFGVGGIRLDFVQYAGRYRTSIEALDRFLTACRERRWAGIANGHEYESFLTAKERLDNLRQGNDGASHDATNEAHLAGDENNDA